MKQTHSPHSPNTLVRRACVALPHSACNSCIEHFYSFGHRQPKSTDVCLEVGRRGPTRKCAYEIEKVPPAMELVGLEPELCDSGPSGASAGSPGMTSVLSHTARDVTLAQAGTQRCYKEGEREVQEPREERGVASAETAVTPGPRQ